MRSFYHTLSILTLFFCSAVNAAGHDADGTYYGDAGNTSYEINRHGLDGAVLLDPFFLCDLNQLKEKLVLDAGCGCGPWTIYCAQQGAHVFGIDIQEGMIKKALNAAQIAGIEPLVKFTVGSVASLPYEENLFDLAISINVGCNLPKDVFNRHFTEMYRCLKTGGKATVTAPACFGIVFTTDVDEESVFKHIDHVLTQINVNPTSGNITKGLNELTEVLRATFAIRNGHLQLITHEEELIAGEDIWRKIPGLTVPNNYHSESEYINACDQAGLVIDSMDQPTGTIPGLGNQYAINPAFTIYHLSKPHSCETYSGFN